jgi:hypothetical protein
MIDLDLFKTSPIQEFPPLITICLAVNRNDCFLYFLSILSLHFFHASSVSHNNFPTADKSICWVVITADLSPFHELGIVAYSDGGLLFFDPEKLSAFLRSVILVVLHPFPSGMILLSLLLSTLRPQYDGSCFGISVDAVNFHGCYLQVQHPLKSLQNVKNSLILRIEMSLSDATMKREPN